MGDMWDDCGWDMGMKNPTLILGVMIVPPTGVCEQTTLLLGELLPCKSEAETALQPLMWHSESLSSHPCLISRGVFYSQTPVSPHGAPLVSMKILLENLV